MPVSSLKRAGLCAAFSGTRLRSHECCVDLTSGFVRSLPALMPLPSGAEYTLRLLNRCIGPDSVVTATVLPTPPPRVGRSADGAAAAASLPAVPARDNGRLVIASTSHPGTLISTSMSVTMSIRLETWISIHHVHSRACPHGSADDYEDVLHISMEHGLPTVLIDYSHLLWLEGSLGHGYGMSTAIATPCYA